ncbi:MAG: sugar phosphate isomerase/epimerase [Alphaproteobacteria bacterium]|nr:sugar phosphate isomerase/epimerase [Alphaproteobacteria bacterium]
MAGTEQICIHQVTLRDQWGFADCVEGLSRNGVHATAVWREKLHDIGLKPAAKLLRDAGMTVTGHCAGGLLTARDPTERRARLDDNRRMIEEAAEIGAHAMVVILGGLEDGDRDVDGARARAFDALTELLPDARSAGVTLGLEPLHPMICANRSVMPTLEMANDWYETLGGGPELGIVIDTYAVWWDPKLAQEIARASGRIVGFHISDWLLDTTGLRFDRGMMGDGVIDFAGIRTMVEDAGYHGLNEVEIFSSGNWWRRDPDDVVKICKDRCGKVFTQS